MATRQHSRDARPDRSKLQKAEDWAREHLTSLVGDKGRPYIDFVKQLVDVHKQYMLALPLVDDEGRMEVLPFEEFWASASGKDVRHVARIIRFAYVAEHADAIFDTMEALAALRPPREYEDGFDQLAVLYDDWHKARTERALHSIVSEIDPSWKDAEELHREGHPDRLGHLLRACNADNELRVTWAFCTEFTDCVRQNPMDGQHDTQAITDYFENYCFSRMRDAYREDLNAVQLMAGLSVEQPRASKDTPMEERSTFADQTLRVTEHPPRDTLIRFQRLASQGVPVYSVGLGEEHDGDGAHIADYVTLETKSRATGASMLLRSPIGKTVPSSYEEWFPFLTESAWALCNLIEEAQSRPGILRLGRCNFKREDNRPPCGHYFHTHTRRQSKKPRNYCPKCARHIRSHRL